MHFSHIRFTWSRKLGTVTRFTGSYTITQTKNIKICMGNKGPKPLRPKSTLVHPPIELVDETDFYQNGIKIYLSFSVLCLFFDKDIFDTKTMLFPLGGRQKVIYAPK